MLSAEMAVSLVSPRSLLLFRQILLLRQNKEEEEDKNSTRWFIVFAFSASILISLPIKMVLQFDTV